MRAQLTKSISGLLIAGLLALPTLIQAQPSAHYVPGVEGIKGASLPPPGFWLRDYNAAYYTEQANDSQGNKAANQKAFIYANVPRLLWITDTKVLGGYLGLDALLPLQYTYVKGFDQTFGIGDLFVEGTWSSHLKQFDLALGYGAWAPTGDTASGPTTRAGAGYWTHMLTAGATWYIDNDKRWAVSALNRYEFSTEKEDTEQIPGQAYTLEYGVSYGVTKTVDVGAAGYYQMQVTPTTGSAWWERNRVAGVGPEISAFFPQWMLGVSFRYAYEFMAENRFQGHTFALTITKKF
jgi:hypothetical protein